MPDQDSLDRAAKRRDAIVRYVASYAKTNGYSPSHNELVTEFGVSNRQISKDIARLERDGRIIRTQGVARTLRVPTSKGKTKANTP